MRINHLFLVVLVLSLAPLPASAQTTFTVGDETALRAAITTAVPGDKIVFGADITLTTGDLPSVHSDITIDGGGHALSGNNQYRGLLVAAFGGGAAPTQVPVAVTIQNINITNTVAQGGSGGSGTAGGGGGGGLGGGLFVAAQANVTLSNVNFASNKAVGGSGGAVDTLATASGGGGGLGGNGGAGQSGAAGGGGGAGRGADGGANSAGGAGILVGAGDGGLSTSSGGVQGGGGASSGQGGAGGGASGGSSGSGTAGDGGFGGGGGGQTIFGAGLGGTGGGGGGGVGGFGGYGGGSGGDAGASGSVPGGFGGGTGGGNGTAGGGGGGGGIGGGIFVQPGGQITVSGGLTINGSSVTGGAGADGGGNGAGYGAGLFFGGNGAIVFASSAGETQTISDTIGDEKGSSGIVDLAVLTLNKTGAGTLVLSGANQYTGGTIVDGGTLSVSSAANLGSGDLTLHNAATLAVTGSGAFGQNINISGTPIVSVGAGQSATVNGTIADDIMLGSGSLTVSGGGTLTLGNAANTYTGGTTVNGNSTVVIGADGALGATVGGVTLGGATTSGTLEFTTATTLSTDRGVTIAAGGGTITTDTASSITLTTGMSGTGLFTKAGSGTLTLSGVSAHSGGTLVGDGILRAGISNAFGSGAMQVGAAGTLDLNGFNQAVGSLAGAGRVTLGSGTLNAGSDNTSTLFSGAISGSGGFVKSGAGVLTLTGANTYTGGTTVSAGTLAGTTDSLQGAIRNDAAVVFDQTAAGTYAGVMSGTGALTKSGSGVVTLTGLNTYSGGTTVSGGTLAGTTDSLQGAIRNDAAVVFDQNGAGAYGGVMSGTGTLTKSGTGVVTLTGANTYSGGTIVNGGALSGTTTSLQGDIANNAIVQFNQAGNGTYAGNMSGSGIFVKSGSGTVTLSGSNTYSGGTMITAGTLAGDSGSIQGDIINDAQLLFNQGVDGAYAGTMVGSGSVTKTGNGTLTLTGQAGYTGGTVISGGTLAGNSLNLQGAIVDNASLRFNQSFDGIFNGSISGTGSLTKAGAGVLVLNGAQSYTGGTTVLAGALAGDDTNLRGAIVNNAQVIFNQSATGTYAGTMSGTGALVKMGAGTLTLSGPNSYSGGTLITAGTLAGDTTSIQGNIVNDARLVFNQLTSGIFNGAIGGSGSLTKNGAGTLTLTGPASYSGGTTISAGTLAGTSVSLQGAIRDDAALLFNQGFSGIFNGAISGTGTLTKSGSGALVLNGTNTYTGGTIVNGGSLVGTTSSLQGTILNNALVEFSQNVNGAYAGTMSGTGSLAKTGVGTLTLSGPNSYAGGTSITGGGAIAVAIDAALGAAAGAVSLGDALSAGTLTFTNAGLFSSSRGFTLGAGGGVFNTTGATVTLSGGLSGAGGLTKTGDGVLELTGTSLYAGSTVIGAGTLRAGASNAFSTGNTLVVGQGAAADLNGFSQSVASIAGTGSILLGRGTLTTGSDNSSGLFAGLISGGGSLVKTGGGTLVLTGANTYGGGTQVLGGALVGNTTSLQGNILNDGLVQFDQNNSGTYAGSMSGSGALAKSGSGVLTLTGANSYSGGTVINGGSVIGNASSLRGLIVNNAQLTFGGTADGVFGGMLTGSGGLVKTGTGTLTLNGAQPLSGLFTVSQGTLALNGLFGGSIDVAAGATLRANGIIAGTLNLAGSLFAVPATAPAFSRTADGAVAGASLDPGAAVEGPSFLTIGRDFTSTGGSLLDFAIGPGATPTILVGGVASLNGAHVNVTAPSIGTARSASFLALSALNGLSLNNTQVTTDDAGVIPVLKQDHNSLFVTLLNLNVPLRRDAGPGTIAIADAIDRSKFDAGGDGGFVVRELTALDDRALKDALEQIGGQLHASVLQTAILDAESVTDLVRDQVSAREMEDGNDVRWWGETACQHADFKSTSTARGGSANVCAGAGGADRRVSEKWTFGGGGSYTGGTMGVGSMGSGDYTAPRAFGYAGYKPSRIGVRGGGSAAKSSYTTQRQIQFQAILPPELGAQPLTEGVNRKAESEQQGATKDAWSEVHDSRKIRTYTLEALLGIRHAQISRGSFSETGALALSLNGADDTLNLTQTDLKVHVFRREGAFRPFFDLNYRRELAQGDTQAAVAFSGLTNSNFIVQGINIPANSVNVKGGLTFMTLIGQATATYEYKQAPGQRRQTIGFRVRFK